MSIPMQKKEHVFDDPIEKPFYIPKEFWVGAIVYPILVICYNSIFTEGWLTSFTTLRVVLLCLTTLVGGSAATIGLWAWKLFWGIK